MSIYRTQYIPKYTPPKKRSFYSYFNDLKYEQTIRDPDIYFKNVKIINFDLIHHQCRGDPLLKQKMNTMQFKNQAYQKYQKITKKEVVGADLELKMK